VRERASNATSAFMNGLQSLRMSHEKEAEKVIYAISPGQLSALGDYR
jgi:hypothetical protein